MATQYQRQNPYEVMLGIRNPVHTPPSYILESWTPSAVEDHGFNPLTMDESQRTYSTAYVSPDKTLYWNPYVGQVVSNANPDAVGGIGDVLGDAMKFAAIAAPFVIGLPAMFGETALGGLGAAGTAAGTAAGAGATTAAGMLAAETSALLGAGFTGAEVAASLAGLGNAGQIASILAAAGIPAATASTLASNALSGTLAPGGGAMGVGTDTLSSMSGIGNNTLFGNLQSRLGELGANLGLGGTSSVGNLFGIPGLSTGNLLTGALQGLGGYLQGSAAQDAASTAANAQLQAARIAADAAKFRPVGVKTRFGESKFQRDADGNIIGAGYQLAPDVKAQQDALMAASGGLLNQFTGAQAATAPMGQAAQSLFGLGQGYLATTPQEQAQKYMDEQLALLAAPRERGLAQLQSRLAAQGRLGLATGGTTSGMMAANPEMEAFFNAQRQQDLGLAAQATQGGMDYAKFGAGLVGTGGDMLRSMYGTQSAAFDPYKTALGGATTIEGLGQNALQQGIDIGRQTSNAASGQLLAQGMQNAANTMQPANAYSPWGSLLSGAGGMLQNYQQQQQQQAQQQQQQQMLNALLWSK